MESTKQQHERHFHSALIVDDHPLFCDALSMTLGTVADIRNIKTSANLTDAVEMIAKGFCPDLIVLDLNLPDVDGLDGLIRLKKCSAGASGRCFIYGRQSCYYLDNKGRRIWIYS